MHTVPTCWLASDMVKKSVPHRGSVGHTSINAVAVTDSSTASLWYGALAVAAMVKMHSQCSQLESSKVLQSTSYKA